MKKIFLVLVLLALSCNNEPINVDVLIRGGVIHDGTGMTGYVGNVAINNDTIFYVGKKDNFIR
jgi:N-acyl-D-aspartate/D-glutamate deacylase